MSNEEIKPLVVFGDCGSEVFDYIFGKNPNYYPFWASGWSARSFLFKKPEIQIQPYSNILKNLNKDINIILHFGMIDVEFSLPMLAKNDGFYNLPQFLNEMISGLTSFRDFLTKEYQFENVYFSFTALPIYLPNSHWINCFKFEPFPLKIRGQLLLDFADKIEKLHKDRTINCLPKLVLSKKNPVCHLDYTRLRISHHIGFIEAQDVIYEELSKIPDILSQRNPKHVEYYPHTNVGVDEVNKNGQPRQNTCR